MLLSCCLLFSPLSVVAQEGSGSAALERVSYDLPHPGILPDNAMYPVKMFRDRVVSMFISDPVKKAEFNLLQADKRLQAGVYLLNKEAAQAELALTAISKGENYLAQKCTNISYLSYYFCIRLLTSFSTCANCFSRTVM